MTLKCLSQLWLESETQSVTYKSQEIGENSWKHCKTQRNIETKIKCSYRSEYRESEYYTQKSSQDIRDKKSNKPTDTDALSLK